MRTTEHCGMSYIRNGDVTECRLPYNHPDDCSDANHTAFWSSLRDRQAAQWEAQQGPWI